MNEYTQTRTVVGVMTGTSLDGLDAALLEITGTGLNQHVRFVKGLSRSLGSVAEGLRELAEQIPMSSGDIASLSRKFSLLHVEAIRELCASLKPNLICVHGQTVFHAPPISWQLMNPAPIVAAMNTPVVFDLRSADLANGGQGAPLTPLADYILYRGLETRTVVNLGGFCNLTRLPVTPEMSGSHADVLRRIEGGDVCACNQLLDRAARELIHKLFDPDGHHASKGRILEVAFDALFATLDAQRRKRVSLGTGDELGGWIQRHRSQGRAEDLLRTLCAGIAEVIARSCVPVERVILAGGGVKNLTLLDELKSRIRAKVELSDVHGIPAEFREAAGFAVLGALCQDRVPITLPQVTGVKVPPVSGCWMFP